MVILSTTQLIVSVSPSPKHVVFELYYWLCFNTLKQAHFYLSLSLCMNEYDKTILESVFRASCRVRDSDRKTLAHIGTTF